MSFALLNATNIQLVESPILFHYHPIIHQWQQMRQQKEFLEWVSSLYRCLNNVYAN